MYVQTSEKIIRIYLYKHKPSPALMRFSTCSALFTISSFSPATNTPRWQKLKTKISTFYYIYVSDTRTLNIKKGIRLATRQPPSSHEFAISDFQQQEGH